MRTDLAELPQGEDLPAQLLLLYRAVRGGGLEQYRGDVGVAVLQDRHSPAGHSGLVLLEVILGDLQAGDDCDHSMTMWVVGGWYNLKL